MHNPQPKNFTRFFWQLTPMLKRSLSFCVLRLIPKMKPVRSLVVIFSDIRGKNPFRLSSHLSLVGSG